MKIKEFKILNQVNPIGIGNAPYFSWKLESDIPNTRQVSYRLIVADESGTIRMDTGLRLSDDNSYLPYTGDPLRSRQACHVSVQVADNHGNEAKAEASFETGLLEENDWKADWVAAPFAFSERGKGFGKQAPASMFRKRFAIAKSVKRARLYATCHGIYQVTINGNCPDERDLAPEYTSYEKYLCYQTYDITGLLKQGENVIGMMVGDGWFFSPAMTENLETISIPHAILFQVEIAYEDGTYETIGSDEQVLCGRGPILFSDLFAGECYDSRLEVPGWDTPDVDMNDWPAAISVDYGYQNLVPQQGEPVRTMATLSPVKIYSSPKGEYIVDFGQNFAGKPCLTVDEPEGQRIQLDVFEEPDNEGNYFNTIFSAGGVGEGADQRIDFISAGKRQTYTPYFTYLGFRYARISGLTKPEAASFSGLALSTEKEELGSFSCSDPDINRLVSNIRWSQRSNMVSIPTDCPQREKAGWSADISLYARTAIQNEDCTNFLSRWLDNARIEQGTSGAVPMLIPYPVAYHHTPEAVFQMESEEEPIGVAGWSDAIIFVPLAMYEITGNKEILKQNYEAMSGWCDYILNQRKRRGDQRLSEDADRQIWNTGFQFGEWLIPSTTKEGTLSPKAVKALTESSKYTTPIFGWRSFEYMSKIAACLGKEEDSSYYAAIAADMQHIISSYLVAEDDKPLWDYMGAYVLLLYFDMVEEQYRPMYEEELVRRIHDNGDCLDTGFLATPFLLQVLEKCGHLDLAYTLLFQKKAPSWLYEVEKGGTTIWEAWTGFKEDGNPQNMSFNHYALGSVAEWIYQAVGGLSSDTPGFRHAVIEPKLNSALKYAKRSFNSVNGWYRVHWTCDGDNFMMDVEIPCNCTATVLLPDGNRHEVGSGNYSYTCKIEV